MWSRPWPGKQNKHNWSIILLSHSGQLNGVIVGIALTFIYLDKVKTAWASFNIKRQEVKGDHVALWLVNDPLTDLVVGIGVGVVGGA